MREIRQKMEEAIKEKDEERQEELREYRSQIDKQMRAAVKQAKQLDMSRGELRRKMKEEHSREISQLRHEISQRQQQLEATSKENNQWYTEMQKELEGYMSKMGRSHMKEGFYYEYKHRCPRCNTDWLFNDLDDDCSALYCRVCVSNFNIK